jgi:ABC-type sugar transport system permease subunit
MAEWISFALSMAVNIVVGLVCGFLLKCCFHRRRFIRVTVAAYWITYVIATVVIDIGESKNIFELLIILLLVMFSALVFR